MTNHQKNNIENNILIILIMIVGYMIMDKLGCFKENFGNEENCKEDNSNLNIALVNSSESNMEEYCKKVNSQVEKCNKAKKSEIVKKCNFSYLDVRKCVIYNKSK